MGALGQTKRVVLPFGLPDGRGGLHRGAVLGPLNGRGELEGSGGNNPFEAANRVLAHALMALGPLLADGISLPLVEGLLPLDRDYLLCHLLALSFGSRQFVTVLCPAEACGAPMDIEVDLDTVEADDTPASYHARLSLEGGGTLAFRLPTAGDQSALNGYDGSERVEQLLARCLIEAPGCLSLAEVQTLPEAARAQGVGGILARSPGLDLTLVLDCLGCGEPFTFRYEPVTALREKLFASRRGLLQEVHYLAFHYGWSQAEILSLDRGLRHTYLSLLEEHFDGRRSLA